MTGDTPPPTSHPPAPAYKVLAADCNVYGPAPMKSLVLWVLARRMDHETLVAEDGTENWRRADTFPELRSALFSSTPGSLQALREGRAPIDLPPNTDFGESPQYADGSLNYLAPSTTYVKSNKSAKNSFICGLVGIFICPLPLSIVAIVLGCIALSQIQKTNGLQQGKGLAIAGLSLGAVSLLARLVIILLMLAS